MPLCAVLQGAFDNGAAQGLCLTPASSRRQGNGDGACRASLILRLPLITPTYHSSWTRHLRSEPPCSHAHSLYRSWRVQRKRSPMRGCTSRPVTRRGHAVCNAHAMEHRMVSEALLHLLQVPEALLYGGPGVLFGHHQIQRRQLRGDPLERPP